MTTSQSLSVWGCLALVALGVSIAALRWDKFTHGGTFKSCKRCLKRLLRLPVAVALFAALCGCQSRPIYGRRDAALYEAMQTERRALGLEERLHNLTNVNALEDILMRNGIERSKIEGLWK